MTLNRVLLVLFQGFNILSMVEDDERRKITSPVVLNIASIGSDESTKTNGFSHWLRVEVFLEEIKGTPEMCRSA